MGADSDTQILGTPPSDPLIGALVLERYRITRALGRGGMGAVYEATHVVLGRRVAIKFLREQHMHNAEMLARFEREARLAASVDDAHVVEVLDVGEADGRMFIAMEMLDGESFASLLAREPLTEQRTAALLAQAARALGAAHAKSIIHRDVKPANLFVTDLGGVESIKVLDFGVSKLARAIDQPALTQAGIVMGTTEYMSPEQARGETLDVRTDIYSLGVVLYEASARRRPFDVGNELETLTRIAAGDLTPLQQVNPYVSDHYAAITARAMAHDREARYATAFELAAELDALCLPASRAAQFPTVMMTAQAAPSRARGISGIWVVTAAILAVAIAIGGYFAISRPATRVAASEPRTLRVTSIAPHDADPRVADIAPSVVESTPSSTGKLFVYLGGATSTPETGPTEVYDFAASLGYRAIALAYSGEACGDPTCVGEHADGSDASSVSTRLAMLLKYLAQINPTAGWDAYLDRDQVRWARVAIAGFGQGAALATALAKLHAVARVVLFSEPLDESAATTAWYRTPSATPADRWFAGSRRRNSRQAEAGEAFRALDVPDAHVAEVSIVLGAGRQERAPGLKARTYVNAWSKLLGDGNH